MAGMLSLTDKGSRDLSLEREIELPLIALGFIFNPASRLGRPNNETHPAMRKYLNRVTPVPADLEILLDPAIQANESFDTSASVCRQVVILLDAHGAVVSISGPVNSSFERRSTAALQPCEWRPSSSGSRIGCPPLNKDPL
jgi:hypothetical protein